MGSLSSIQDDEQEYYDNMPESFQYGEKGSAVEEIIDTLQSALDELDTASTSLTDCVEYLVQARD